MYNPFAVSLKFQQAAVEGAAAASKVMIDSYLHLLEQQQVLLVQALPHRRHQDVTTQPKQKVARKRKTPRKKASPCNGPDLQDHYGKRAHDVDVEHI